MRYRLEWDRGPKAVIDLHCSVKDVFMLRYDGPFQLTLRRGLEELPITKEDLEERVKSIRKLAGSMGLRGARGPRTRAPAADALDNLRDEGGSLFNLVLPQSVASDLGATELFIDIGTDEALIPVPWELMCDTAGFICLRHAVGRYVNLKQPLDLNRPLGHQGEVRVLLISVPKPQPIRDMTYETLPEAEAEFTAISNLLVDRGIDFLPLQGRDATKNRVRNELHSDRAYTIIHFTGHGHVDVEDPRRSGLVLHDGILTTGVIWQFLRHAPILAFINGCETAAGTGGPAPGGDADTELSIAHLTRVFGIARPLLNRGSYVLGTRWRVGDSSATTFAKTFYAEMLGGKPIGAAITRGRNAAFEKGSSDLSWASYVFYGDPRLMIELGAEHEPEGDPGPGPMPQGQDGTETGEEPEGEPGSMPRAGASSGWGQVEPETGGADADLGGIEVATESGAPPSEPAASVPLVPILDDTARAYVEMRQTTPAGTRRTLDMERLLDGVRSQASAFGREVVAECLRSDHEGRRIVGIVLATAAPSRAYFPGLIAMAGTPLSRFEEYHAFRALRAVVDQLAQPEKLQLQALLLERLTDEEFVATDRAYAAREILAGLDRHLGDSTINGNPDLS